MVLHQMVMARSWPVSQHEALVRGAHQMGLAGSMQFLESGLEGEGLCKTVRKPRP